MQCRTAACCRCRFAESCSPEDPQSTACPRTSCCRRCPIRAAISAEYLEQLGYGVDHATNGSDALRKLQHGPPYSFVLSDILMPGSVAGLELARIVREHHSEIPILLATGYSDKAQKAVHDGF